MMTRLIPIPALALAAMAITPASAEEHVWATGDGYTIRAAGLDLATVAGRAALLRRIETAGQRLCTGVAPRVDRSGCISRATDRAVAGAASAIRAAYAAALLDRGPPRYAER